MQTGHGLHHLHGRVGLTEMGNTNVHAQHFHKIVFLLFFNGREIGINITRNVDLRAWRSQRAVRASVGFASASCYVQLTTTSLCR